MKRALIVAAFALLGATSAPQWLDASTPAAWNVAGAPIPARAGPADKELASGGHCAAGLRPPSSPEDRAVVARGWSLVGPYTRYGSVSAFLASSSADGMCRPNGFQAFVFVNGVFAGTLAPRPMDGRTDASLEGAGVAIENEQAIDATFARYGENDPLCCPHGSTIVSYAIRKRAGASVVVPLSAMTSNNRP